MKSRCDIFKAIELLSLSLRFGTAQVYEIVHTYTLFTLHYSWRIVKKLREWIRNFILRDITDNWSWCRIMVKSSWGFVIKWNIMVYNGSQFSVNSTLDYNYFRKWSVFIYWGWLIFVITIWYYKIWYMELGELLWVMNCVIKLRWILLGYMQWKQDYI